MYIHRDDKPYSCDWCGKGFNRRDALKRHQQGVLEGKKKSCMTRANRERTPIE